MTEVDIYALVFFSQPRGQLLLNAAALRDHRAREEAQARAALRVRALEEAPAVELPRTLVEAEAPPAFRGVWDIPYRCIQWVSI